MDEDSIADLKQFIATVVRTTVREEIAEALAASEARMSAKIEAVDSKVDEVLAAVADAMTTHTEDIDERLNNHEKRLTRLEHKPA